MEYPSIKDSQSLKNKTMLFLGFLFSCNESRFDTREPVLEPVSFDSAKECQDCHPQQYKEWSQSMHAYAAKSPVFDAMAQKAYRDTAGEVKTFCTGCHSPLGEVEGESGAITADQRSKTALEGVTCDYCHTSVDHNGIIGNNHLVHTQKDVKFGPFSDTKSEEHGTEKHDFITSPELCGSCHDVFAYPSLQIEQAFTEYTQSPSAQQGQRCQDCHMSPDPGVDVPREIAPIAVEEGKTYPDRPRSSHFFVGPDYSLIDDFPYPNDLEKSAQAQEEHLLRVERLLQNAVQISSLDAQINNSSLTINLEIESLVQGHRVPTGFTSERQLWIYLRVSDANGEEFFRTGALDANGDLYDSHSELVANGTYNPDRYLVNLQSKNWVFSRQYSGNGALLADIEEQRVEYETIFPFDADYIERHSLAPLEKRPLHFQISTNRPSPYKVQATIRYRNLPPYMLRALHLHSLVERLKIFDIDTQTITVQ